jgi:hypothetical protein
MARFNFKNNGFSENTHGSAFQNNRFMPRVQILSSLQERTQLLYIYKIRVYIYSLILHTRNNKNNRVI